MLKRNQELIRLALDVARSGHPGEIPIAALIFDVGGIVVGSGRNRVHETGDSTNHAEILALKQLASSGHTGDAHSLTLAVTLEPCPMCAWAIRAVGIERVVFGAFNMQYGAAGSVYDLLRDTRVGRPVEVIGGVLESECKDLLRTTFMEIRDNKTW